MNNYSMTVDDLIAALTTLRDSGNGNALVLVDVDGWYQPATDIRFTSYDVGSNSSRDAVTLV